MTLRERVGRIVVGVARQALADSGADALILLDDGSPEALLARDWCTEAAGPLFLAVGREALGAGEMRAILEARPGWREQAGGPILDLDALAAEGRRLDARLRAAAMAGGALLANPINKTALVLSAAGPPEPLLPLGDLWATDVRELAGGYSLPTTIRALAENVGGIDALDGALRACIDERRALEEALAPLADPARARVQGALVAARFARRRVGLVPKLGPRTPGIDLFA